MCREKGDWCANQSQVVTEGESEVVTRWWRGCRGVGVGKASRPGQNTNANARDLTDCSRSNRDFRQTDGVQMIGQHSAIERGESNDAGTHRTDTCVGKTSHTLRTVQNFGEQCTWGESVHHVPGGGVQHGVCHGLDQKPSLSQSAARSRRKPRPTVQEGCRASKR